MKRLQFANSAGSTRAMSIVLYALGAGLFAWSAYLLVAGDSYAAMDIAASLAGWGAFTIGLGAVAAAIGRLTRVIAERGARPIVSEFESDFAEETAEEIVPVFIARGGEPGHFEPSPAEQEPVEAPAPAEAPAPEPETRTSEPELRPRFEPRIEARRIPVGPVAPTPEPAVEPDGEAPSFEPETPVVVAQPEPAAAEPAIEPPVARITADEDDPSVPKRSDLTREERRAMRLKARQERQAEAAEKSRAAAEAAVAPDAEAENVSDAGDEPQQAAPRPAEEPAPAPRPIMPRRREWDFDLRGKRNDQSEVPDDTSSPAAAEAPAPTPEPKVPEWLARARERRAARMKAGEDEPAVDAPPVFVSAPAPEPTVEPEPKDTADPEPPAAASEAERSEQEEAPPSPRVVREGEHNGVHYRFFEDGSVEAESAHGVRRFSSIDELRETVLAARGAVDEDAAAPELGPETPTPQDPLDEALAELEGRSAPEPRVDPDDRPRLRR